MPGRSGPTPLGQWVDVPGSEVRQQVKLALPAEAIARIRRVDGQEWAFELKLEDVRMIDQRAASAAPTTSRWCWKTTAGEVWPISHG